MKSYDVLFAFEVPHYGPVTVEAITDSEAIGAACAYGERVAAGDALEPAYDPARDGQVCERIVSLRDPDGNLIATNTALDSSFLRRGGDAERRLCDAASELLPEAIKAVALIESAWIGFNEAVFADAPRVDRAEASTIEGNTRRMVEAFNPGAYATHATQPTSTTP